MKNDTLEDVKEFFDSFHLRVGDVPGIPKTGFAVQTTLHHYSAILRKLSVDLHKDAAFYKNAPGGVLTLRLHLLMEEVAELVEALEENSLTKTLDALCDIRYVADGFTLTLGLHNVFTAAFKEVHASNMTKLDKVKKPVINEAGRVVKSEQYRPPDLKKLLEEYWWQL